MKKICIVCKKEFVKKPSESIRYWKTKKICNIKCYGIYQRGKSVWKNRADGNPNRHSTKKVICKCGCGELINKYDDRGRVKVFKHGHHSRGIKRPELSKHLKELFKSGKLNPTRCFGKDHWNWKGGISKNHRRETQEYIEWRNKVYRKDKWICQDCKIHCKNGDIVAHHLKDWLNYPKLRYKLNNGITLCRSCHKKRHKEIHRYKIK